MSDIHVGVVCGNVITVCFVWCDWCHETEFSGLLGEVGRSGLLPRVSLLTPS